MKFLVLICSIFIVLPVEGKDKTICLNMIVKNEKEIIADCLKAVKPLIDYWVIVDTGSTDGTQAKIKECMAGIPGELYEMPWVNFAYNRNAALSLAQGKGDYLFIIDADDYCHYPQGFSFSNLDKDCYYLQIQLGSTAWFRPQLINNHIHWRWVGVLHEYLQCPQAKTNDTVEGVTIFANHFLGARSRVDTVTKYLRDAATLEEALKTEPNNSRYRFYLAQSYKDAQCYEKAQEHYKLRVAMGGWDEEVFYSLLQIARLDECLQRADSQIVASYYQAYSYRPTRAEPLHYLATFYRNKKEYFLGYITAKHGLSISKPNDLLLLDSSTYEYGLLLEYSICAYWLQKYDEALQASICLLQKTDLPIPVQECVKHNISWIQKEIAHQQVVLK